MKKIGQSKELLGSRNRVVNQKIGRECKLTKRECEILELLASGYNNPQIAEKLFISRLTVEQHRKNIIRKLDAKSFVQLILHAQKLGMI
jgi:DNA-binding NarL/FixJ family response regulator